MELFSFDNRQTTLDLNGPVLSWSTEPSSDSVNTCGVSTFTGIATATFPTQTPANPAKLTGSLTYQWRYKVGSATTDGPLTNGTMAGLGLTGITGAGTTTLTVYGTSTVEPYTISGLQFFLSPDYVPSAYGTGDPITVGTARSTPNANNEVFDSTPGAYTFNPTINISTQPENATAAETQTAQFDVAASVTDSTNDNLTYKWQLNESDLSNSSTVSGADSNSLSISLPDAGSNTVRARISHPTACNSPLYSANATFEVVDARKIIKWEHVHGGTAELYGTGEVNLSDESKTFNASVYGKGAKQVVIYAPEEDVDVKITFAGPAGGSHGGNATGGHGGLSVFTMTIQQNTEYTIKLSQGGGAPPVGGGGQFFYKKGTLLVAMGGGGGSGTVYRGGAGGGIGIAGEQGQGQRSGAGGHTYATGQLPLQGYFAGGNWLPPTSGYCGGRVSGCTFGQTWVNDGYSACQDLGYVRFRGANGSFGSSTTNTINRGYKAGLGHRGNSGSPNGGGGAVGGCGSRGGQGANNTGSDSGGGGGSGYSNGEVTVVSTQLGGNSSTNGYLKIEAD